MDYISFNKKANVFLDVFFDKVSSFFSKDSLFFDIDSEICEMYVLGNGFHFLKYKSEVFSITFLNDKEEKTFFLTELSSGKPKGWYLNDHSSKSFGGKIKKILGSSSIPHRCFQKEEILKMSFNEKLECFSNFISIYENLDNIEQDIVKKITKENSDTIKKFDEFFEFCDKITNNETERFKI